MTILSGESKPHSDAPGDSRKYGRPKDPRLVPEMAEKVAEARKRWESRGVSKFLTKDGSRPKRSGYPSIVQLSFDEMLDALLDSCLSYVDIGIICGVGRERIRQIHRDYFSSVLPYRHGTGFRRVKTCTLVRRKENAEAIRLQGATRRFADAAEPRGLAVKPLLWIKKGASVVGAYARRVDVGGKVIEVRERRTAWTTSKRGSDPVRYFRFHVREKCDYYALFCGAPLNSWFIFPCDLVRRRSSFYIPERPNTYWMNAHLKQTDWIWQYREAWHLLKGAD